MSQSYNYTIDYSSYEKIIKKYLLPKLNDKYIIFYQVNDLLDNLFEFAICSKIDWNPEFILGRNILYDYYCDDKWERICMDRKLVTDIKDIFNSDPFISDCVNKCFKEVINSVILNNKSITNLTDKINKFNLVDHFHLITQQRTTPYPHNNYHIFKLKI